MAQQGHISPDRAVTLDGLFHERVRRTPDAIAYRYFDDASREWLALSWADMLAGIARWQAALRQENLQPGDRVGIMLRNGPTWVMFDQAALGLGLVTVPIFTSDRPDNVAYLLQDSDAKLLLVEQAERWEAIRNASEAALPVERIVVIEGANDELVRPMKSWLPVTGAEFVHVQTNPHHLASIVYTSGTTGRPKGVMLSHRNILANAWNSMRTFDVRASDVFFSFLPLSHMLERTAGYYIPVMAGAEVGFARSFQQLQEDLGIVRPTVLISVPRIYERIHASLRSKLEKSKLSRRLFELAVDIGYSRFEHTQGRGPWRPSHVLGPLLDLLIGRKLRQRLGGRLRAALAGGAALSPDLSRIFLGLGLPILQGYGLTEASPVISVNRLDHNKPESVGPPIPEVEVKTDTHHVLHTRSEGVMQGYWRNEAATRAVIDAEGWLNTGDIVRIDEDGHITIVGRMKDIIVMSNGEKVPPVDLENAILRDPLFEQVMVVGEGKAYLSTLVVLNRELWNNLSNEAPETHQAQQLALNRIAQQIIEFPAYVRIRRVALLTEPWTVENGLLTPTLKTKRGKVLERYREEYERLYEGY